MTQKSRCQWAESSPHMAAYHDLEWGRPSHEEGHLFEMLLLEGAQAGLSWSTILSKRENYRVAFDGFDPRAVARYDADKVALLLGDPGIVRNRAKIASAINNARSFLEVQAEFGGFGDYLWAFTGGEPVRNRPERSGDVPARSELSDAVSKDLRRRGFSFVGSTIVYAFLQSVGVVNDHLVSCAFRDPD